MAPGTGLAACYGDPLYVSPLLGTHFARTHYLRAQLTFQTYVWETCAGAPDTGCVGVVDGGNFS